MQQIAMLRAAKHLVPLQEDNFRTRPDPSLRFRMANEEPLLGINVKSGKRTMHCTATVMQQIAMLRAAKHLGPLRGDNFRIRPDPSLRLRMANEEPLLGRRDVSGSRRCRDLLKDPPIEALERDQRRSNQSR